MPNPDPESPRALPPAQKALLDDQYGVAGQPERPSSCVEISKVQANPAYAAPNVVTLLTAKGKRLTKRITKAGEKKPAETPTLFTHAAEPVDDLEDLFGLLRWASSQTDTYIVRPAVIEGTPAVIRRKSSGPEQGLIDMPRSWLMVDIDKDVLTFPSDWRSDPERPINALIKKALPAAFHGAGVIAQFSSQMLADGGTPRVHLWFWLHRPLISSEAKHWLNGCPIDRAVYSGGQPHFTAAPIFEGGVDPLGESRLIFLPGPDVEVPEGIDTSEPEEVDVDLSVDMSRFINLASGDNRWRREIPKIGNSKGFHDGINDAAMAYVACTYNPQAGDPAGDIDYAEFERTVIEHVSTLKLTPDRQADLDNRLRDMPRCFWGALPRVQQEIRKFGLPALLAPTPARRGSLAELMARAKVRSRHDV